MEDQDLILSQFLNENDEEKKFNSLESLNPILDKMAEIGLAEPYNIKFNKFLDEWACQYYYVEKAFLGRTQSEALKKSLIQIIEDLKLNKKKEL